MQGDTFEMEDQRNWTDASFKTYCTPLELPYPVLITKRAKVSQRVDISIEGLDKLPNPSRDPDLVVVVPLISVSGKDRQPLPGIGLQVSSQTEQLSDGEIERLRELHLDHVRVDVTPADQTASAKLPELNRQRPDPATVDVVSYGINPQIHAYDNTSIIETLEIQGETVHSAKQFVGDRPLLISPITLKKQAISEPPPVGELPANVDPRQTSMFVAGWTLGSIKYLAEAGAEKRHLFRNGRLAQHHGSRRRLAAAARSARVSRPRRFRRPQVSSERPARDRRGRPSVHAQCGVGRPAHSGR